MRIGLNLPQYKGVGERFDWSIFRLFRSIQLIDFKLRFYIGLLCRSVKSVLISDSWIDWSCLWFLVPFVINRSSRSVILNRLDSSSTIIFQSLIWPIQNPKIDLVWDDRSIGPIAHLASMRLCILAPGSACHFDADPDPDPSFQVVGSKPWKSAQIGSYSTHFVLSSANWCGSGSSLSLWCRSWFGSYLSIWSGSIRIRKTG